MSEAADRVGIVHASHRFAEDHPALAGHFPGNPLLPGVVVLDAVLSALGPRLKLPIRVEEAKFLHPVRGGETVDIEASASSGQIRFTGSVAGRRVISGRIAAP